MDKMTETDKMTLADLGSAVSVFMENAEKAIMDYLGQAVPLACGTYVNW